MFKYTEVGVDLGRDTIKFAVTEKTGRSGIARKGTEALNKLTKSETYKVDSPLYSSDYFHSLKIFIKDFAAKHKLSRISLNIAVSLDNESSHISFIKMPVVGEKLMEDGVTFEAEQNMAVEGIENSNFTWKVTNENPEIGEYEILLAYLKKEVVRSLAQFKTIKWKVNRVILQPIVLERVVSENAVLIDLGHKGTRVYIYKEGKLVQIELIEMGGEELLKDIEMYLTENEIEDIDPREIIQSIPVYNKKLDMLINGESSEYNHDEEVLFMEPYRSERPEETLESIFLDPTPEKDEVESLFLEDSIEEDVLDDVEDLDNLDEDIEENNIDESEEEQEEILPYDEDLIKDLSKLLFPKIEIMIDEVKRIVRMYELQNAITSDMVYYVGQLSNMPFLKETIESELELDLKPISFLDISNDDEVEYGIASLVSMDSELKEPTNFSKYIKANVDYKSVIIILLMISLSTGIAFKLIVDNYTEQLQEMQMTESTQNGTISELDGEAIALQEDIDKSQNFVSKMEMLKQQKKWLSDILFVIPEKTPLTIAISNLDIIDNKVVLQGYSSDYSSIGFFANELTDDNVTVEINTIDKKEKSGDIYSVTLENPELISDKYKMGQSFSMTLTYQGPLFNH